MCGKPRSDGTRQYCDACLPLTKEALVAAFSELGPAALVQRRTMGDDPHMAVKRGARRVRAIAHTSERFRNGSGSMRKSPILMYSRENSAVAARRATQDD